MQNSTDKPVFHALADMPERGVVFANAMKWHSMQQGFSTDHLVHSFPWANELLVVDVGGGQGHVSCALANHNPSVRCIVEDQQDAISQGEKNLATSLKGRVNFRAHDFFAEQPVKNADVYLLRLILHDWSDKYAKRILRALIPALRHGAKVIIQDRVVPGYGEVTLLQEREARYVQFSRSLTKVGEAPLIERHIETMICICWPFKMQRSEALTIGLFCSGKWMCGLSLWTFDSRFNLTSRS